MALVVFFIFLASPDHLGVGQFTIGCFILSFNKSKSQVRGAYHTPPT